MKNYRYVVKPNGKMSLEQLRRELIAIEEDHTEDAVISLIQIKPEQNAAVLITPNRKFVNALRKDKRFLMTEQPETK